MANNRKYKDKHYIRTTTTTTTTNTTTTTTTITTTTTTTTTTYNNTGMESDRQTGKRGKEGSGDQYRGAQPWKTTFQHQMIHT
ncbi:hypothetical protein E2C01_102378 [Portunus trituberculatus]|uniref:Uncharacterized protein n=1 Tax=Portunus trituberculatus TaxID=210409 RepID=A0A5B7K818_PORTR|nr:hypothetical protein [Portunus trituberculatus]